METIGAPLLSIQGNRSRHGQYMATEGWALRPGPGPRARAWAQGPGPLGSGLGHWAGHGPQGPALCGHVSAMSGPVPLYLYNIRPLYIDKS